LEIAVPACYYRSAGERKNIERNAMRVLLCIVSLVAFSGHAYEPTSNYSTKEIEGWTVFVNKTLLEEEKAVGERVLRLLRVKLYEINRVVPEKALEELHKVPIWLEFKNEDVACACYHPSREWLTRNGFNPEKARSVEIGNAKTFLRWTLDQPAMVLHELAHAYHNRVLGDDDPNILAAYKRAVEDKSYESVLRFSGRMERAYALNNAKEYFAELTEAYFGQNDFYPFVRAEVLQHDPEMAEVLKKAWRESPSNSSKKDEATR
jgi:hypothetical protein